MTRIENFAPTKEPSRLAYVVSKFREYQDKGRIPLTADMNDLFHRAEPYRIRPAYLQAIAWTFGIADQSKIRVFKFNVSWKFMLVFIVCGLDVIEICSHRSIRSINHIYEHWMKRLPIGRSEAEMLKRMSITKFMSFQQGGLIRGKLTPRITGKCKLSITK